MKKQESVLATAGGAGAILLWSTTIAVSRSLSEQVGPITAGAGALTVAGVLALASFLRSGRERQGRILRLPPRYLVWCGALFVGYMLLMFLAIGWATTRVQVLEIGLLNYLWPPLTLVLSLVLLDKRANWLLPPATLLALVGIFLVMTQGGSVSWASFSANFLANPSPYLLAFGAAVSWALYSNLTNRWAGGQNEGGVVLFLPAAAVVLVLISVLFDEPGDWNRRALLEALFLGVVMYAGYGLWDNAMRRGNVVIVTSGSYLTPLLSTIMSCLYLAVIPGTQLWVGCGLLIVGSLLSWRSITDANVNP